MFHYLQIIDKILHFNINEVKMRKALSGLYLLFAVMVIFVFPTGSYAQGATEYSLDIRFIISYHLTRIFITRSI